MVYLGPFCNLCEVSMNLSSQQAEASSKWHAKLTRVHLSPLQQIIVAFSTSAGVQFFYRSYISELTAT